MGDVIEFPSGKTQFKDTTKRCKCGSVTWVLYSTLVIVEGQVLLDDTEKYITCMECDIVEEIDWT